MKTIHKNKNEIHKNRTLGKKNLDRPLLVFLRRVERAVAEYMKAKNEKRNDLYC